MEADLTSLYKLSYFLAEKFRQRVVVLIDEYEALNSCAYDHGYFEPRTSIPGQWVFRVRCTSCSLEGDHD